MNRDTLIAWVLLVGVCVGCGDNDRVDAERPEPAAACELSVEVVSTQDDCAWLGVVAVEGIYFQSGTDAASRTLRMLPRSGEPSIEIAAGAARWMDADARHVYWLDPFDETLRRAPIGGTGAPETIASGVRSAAIGGDHVYWILSEGPVQSQPKSGGTSVELGDLGEVLHVVANDTGAYVAVSDGQIVRLDAETKSSELVMWTAPARSLAIAGWYLYAYVDEGDTHSVVGVTIGEREPWVVLSGRRDSGYLRADHRAVYLITPMGAVAPGVIEMPHDGGPISALAIDDERSVLGFDGDGFASYACDLGGGIVRIEHASTSDEIRPAAQNLSPRAVAGSSDCLGPVAISRGDIYYASTTQIVRLPGGREPIEVVAEADANEIAVGSDHLYWGDPHAMTIHRVALSGGEPTVVGSGYQGSFALEGGRVFWVVGSDNGASRIVSAPEAGGEPTTLAELELHPRTPIAVDVDDVYVVAPDGVMRVDRQSGRAELVASVSGSSFSIVAAGERLLVHEHHGQSGPSAIYEMSRAGGEKRRIGFGSGAGDIAMAGDTLYWVTSAFDGDTTVGAAAASCEASTILVSGERGTVSHLAAAADNLAWCAIETGEIHTMSL